MDQSQTDQSKDHGAHLRNLGADGHRTFAVAVGQIPSRHRKQDERHGEDSADQGDHGVLHLFAGIEGPNGEYDEPLEEVVAECALELGHEQAPETAERVLLLHVLRKQFGTVAWMICQCAGHRSFPPGGVLFRSTLLPLRHKVAVMRPRWNRQAYSFSSVTLVVWVESTTKRDR